MTCPLQQKLEASSGLKLKLKINDNRSTMLSIKWDPVCTKISLHRMFLEAPKNIMDSLACYLRHEEGNIPLSIRRFMENKMKGIDYSHQLDQTKLYCHGHVYNLKKIYHELNNQYFNNELDLSITWFGNGIQRNRSRVMFGLYNEGLRLIKINRLLDSPTFPDYIVSFVIYHEMLHHVCPSYFDGNGQHQIHTKEFRAQEKKFRYYEKAQLWIEENKSFFFA